MHGMMTIVPIVPIGDVIAICSVFLSLKPLKVAGP